jgi:hypothetical protein
MTYRDNVTMLAAERGLVNDPQTGLREEDLGIGGLHFWDDRGGVTRIIGGKMNRASRLFFEHHAGMKNDKPKWVISGKQFEELKALAPAYFAELWEDTSQRPLLDAFKYADSVTLYWKSNPNWLHEFNQNDYGWEEILPDPDWPL